MNIYLATIDEFYTYQPFGRNDGQWEKRRRQLLVEAEDIDGAVKEALRVGEANAMMGPRHLGIEFLRAHRVTFPAALECEYTACNSEKSP